MKKQTIKEVKPKRIYEGRPLKYGEPCIKIHPFWVPVSKKEHLTEVIKNQLKEYENEYLESVGKMKDVL